MAQVSKRLVESDGVMATRNPRQGKALPEAIKQLVVQFYQQDSVSCMMPGKKDYVSIYDHQWNQNVCSEETVALQFE